MGKLSDCQKIEICKKYSNGISAYALAKDYGIANQCIYALLKRRNISIRPTRKYAYDYKFFDNIDTQEKAYWLGNLYADGNIHRVTLSLKLGAKDKTHVFKFKKAMRAEHPVKYLASKNAYVIKIHDTLLPKKLAAVGILPNKSHIITKPPISQDLMIHFIRGFFDGDGWITKTKLTKTRCPYFTIGFASCSIIFLNFIKSYFNCVCNENFGSICPKKSGVSQLMFTGNNSVLKIGNLMYANTEVCLERKRREFQKLQKLKKKDS